MHLSRKPGNVREFVGCQGNVRKLTKNQDNVRGKLVRENSLLLTSCLGQCWCLVDCGGPVLRLLLYTKVSQTFL